MLFCPLYLALVLVFDHLEAQLPVNTYREQHTVRIFIQTHVGGGWLDEL